MDNLDKYIDEFITCRESMSVIIIHIISLFCDVSI